MNSKLIRSKENKKRINEITLVNYLSSNSIPISIVENESFKKFVNSLGTNYEIPNVKDLLNISIPKLYTSTKNDIEKYFKDNSSNFLGMSLTADYFTVANKIPYIDLTVNFITTNFKSKIS